MARTYDFVPATGQMMDTENAPPPAFIPPVVELLDRILDGGKAKIKTNQTGSVICPKCRTKFDWRCIGLSNRKPQITGRCQTPNCLRLMAAPVFTKPTPPPAKRKAKRALPGSDE